MPSSLGNTIRSGTKWLLAGSVGGQLLTFAFGVVLARLLVPDDFGMLVTIQIFTGLMGYVSGGGMGQALVWKKDTDKLDYDIVFTMQLFIGSIIYIFFFYISPGFANWFGVPLYEDLLRVSAISFIIRPFVNLPSNKLYREERYRATSFIHVVILVLTSIISIGMAFYGYGVWSLVWGGIVGSLFAILILWPLSGWRPGFAWNKSRAKKLAGYGFLVSANDIVLYLKNQTANFILTRLLGPGSVGLFNKADSLSNMPAERLGGAVYQTVFRGLSSVQDNIDKSRYIYFRAVTLILVYTAPIYIFLFYVAEPFIRFVYGEKWSAAGEPLSILAAAGIFLCLQQQSGAVAAARNGLKGELRIQAETWFIMIVTSLIGVQFGLKGIAFSVVISTLYATLRLTSWALKLLESDWKNIFISFKPAVRLNIPLFIMLYGLDFGLPDYIYNEYPGAYTLIILIVTLFVYMMLLLNTRMPELESEVNRIKKILSGFKSG